MTRAAWLFLLFFFPLAGVAQEAQTVLHLLDYIGVDYAGAVEAGSVKNADEYKEMLEFTGQVTQRLKALPENPRKAALIGQSEALARLVADRKAPAEVAAASAKLRSSLVDAYKLRLAPRAAPPLERAKTLYVQHCAACHGAEGRGDGPAAKNLEPSPSDFHDLARMAKRSVYGLYNTISLGVGGTSMAPFSQLSEEERWALAFHVANLGIPDERVRDGQRLWQAGKAHKLFADLSPVATLSTEETSEKHGIEAARVQDYLRAHPEVLRPSPIAFSRQKLNEAVEAVARGERALAREAAITAYLEGFELVEGPLANVDRALMRDIEHRMLGIRAAIESGATTQQLQGQVESVDALLIAAEGKLGTNGLSAGSAFTASVIILLREGLEAILVLAAIMAFVAKTGRRDALPWVHAGWIAALALGALTWVLATFVVEVSGAHRELTEGVTALLAAAMLLYVGWWLHAKAYAQAWTRFIKERVGQALARRTLWAIGGVSFLAVYREMFEIVLFYETLWAQAGDSGRTAVAGGAVTAAVVLAAIGIAIFKYSVRLPIGPFFGATSALLALLAVAFTGHGVAALQEAGIIGVTSLPFDPIPLLGIYPSGEALAAQLFALALVALGFWAARRSAQGGAATI